MSAMADTTSVIATVKNTAAKEKAPNQCTMDRCVPTPYLRIRRDKRKEVQTRLDFRGSSKKTRKARDYSLSSSDSSPPARHRHTLEKSKTYVWRRNDGKSVFNLLSYRKKSAFERLSDTYSPSTTKSGPSRASSRDHSQGRNRPRVKDLLRGVEESYGDTQSSLETKTVQRSLLRRGSLPPARRKRGQVSPRHLAYQQAAPAMEDAGNQREKGTRLQVKTWPYTGLARM
ncbi:hypothetical protein Tco_0691281 [Tanacetum coccineum]